MLRSELREAVRNGLPIFIGYFPAAVAFGLLAKTSGATLLEAFLFSAVVFAGASQFIALNLLVTGVGTVGIILTTLLVNFRHFLMGASLSTRMTDLPGRLQALVAFGVTDETFSVLSFYKGKLTPAFVLGVQFIAYSGWVSGTLAGYLAGGFMPEVLTQSMGVALYSLLLAILMPEVKSSLRSLFLALGAGALNTLLIAMDFLPKGWTIIVCILVVSTAGGLLSIKYPAPEVNHG